MKEWLAAREVAFESIDITADDRGLAALTALGVQTVPVVARGEAWVTGQRLDQVAALVGIDHDDSPTLSPAQLLARLDRTLDTAIRLTGQIPTAKLGDKLPNRDRTYLALTNHLVEVAVGFVQVTDGARLTARRGGAVPDVERELPALTKHCEQTRSALDRWWATTDDRSCARIVDTFAGELDLHRVLERTTWHCAQHTRQLAMVLESLGIEAEDPLGPVDLQGLPMPTQVWDG